MDYDMTKLTAMKTIEFEEELTKEQIIDKMKELLRSNFNRVRIKKRKNKPSRLRCFIKTPLSNPIVSLSGKVDIQVKANKARISIIVKPEPNMWFWFEACFIPFTAGIMIIIMIMIMFTFFNHSAWFNIAKRFLSSLETL